MGMKGPDLLAFGSHGSDAPGDGCAIHDQNDADMRVRIYVQKAVQPNVKPCLLACFTDGGLRDGFAEVDIASRKSPAARGRFNAPANQPDPAVLAGHGARHDFWIDIKNKSASATDLPEVLFCFDIALFKPAATARAIFGPIRISRVLQAVMDAAVVHCVSPDP